MKLESGNVIELVNGERYVWNDMHTTLVDLTGEKILIKQFIDLTTFKYVTRIVGEKPSKNIIRIYSDYTLTTVIWERDDGTILTEIERAILSGLSIEYKWIARDEDGNLYIFKTKPKKNMELELWEGEHYASLEIYNHLFKFIKWEDEEPRPIISLTSRY